MKRAKQADWTGRRTRRPVLAALALASIASLVFATAALAGKSTDSLWPLAGSGLDGALDDNQGVAVNQATGHVYVVDKSHSRVVRFAPDGTFERSWGGGVVASGPDNVPQDEVQRLQLRATGGTYTLSFDGQATAPLAHDASAATIEAALEALPNLEPADVSVGAADLNFGPYDRVLPIEFSGADADADVPALVATSSLTGPAPVAAEVATTVAGAAAGEVCVPAEGDTCQIGRDDGAAGAFTEPTGIAVEPVTGDVYVGDTGPNRAARVQKFDGLGAFQRAWGRNVVRHGGAGDVPVPEVKRIFYRPSPAPPPSGGTFTLSFDGFLDTGQEAIPGHTTAPIAFDASAATVEAAMEALPALDSADVSVTGPAGDWAVTFAGAYAAFDPRVLIVDDEEIVPATARIFSSTSTPLDAAPEICMAPADCRGGDRAPGLEDFARGGEFGDSPLHLAVGPGGNVYTLETGVSGAANNRVQRFDSDGDFELAWGEDVIEAGKPGDLGADNGFADPGPVEICTVAADCKQGGNHGGIPGRFHSPTGIATDPAGRVYVVDSASGEARIHRFDSDGTNPAYFADAALATAALPSGQSLAGIAVDPSSGNLFVSTIDAASGERVIREIDPSGALVEDHAVGAQIPPPVGLAYRDSDGALFASLSGGALNTVALFDDDGGVDPAEVTVSPATAVGARVATLHGSVNPKGTSTTYSFQLSTDGGAGWIDVPTPPLSDPVGTVPEEVQTTATGLEANKSHIFRIRARSQLIGTAISPAEEFTTDPLPPEVVTFPANRVTATSAALRGRANPNNMPTTYQFEWGETPAYGNFAPAPAAALPEGGLEKAVPPVELSGLQPETIYHFRLRATNDEGTDIGEDVAFTTRALDIGLAGRVPEMVTPPFKATRSPGAAAGTEDANANPAIPSLDGERLLWTTAYFPLSDDQQFPFDGDRVMLERTGEPSWRSRSLVSLTMLDDQIALSGIAIWRAASGDLATQTWFFNRPILPNAGAGPLLNYTRREGTGTAGFTGWLDDVDTQLHTGGDPAEAGADQALLNDLGTAMARWGPYRGLADPGDPSDDQQLAEQPGGDTLYLQHADDPDDLPTAAKELVGECTGTGVDRTLLPNRIGSGAATDTIGTRFCGAGALTSPRGAVLGSRGGGPAGALLGPAATAMSDDGRRIFFTSPDPGGYTLGSGGESIPIAPAECAAATGASTNCPPQLFVRQYDANGENPVVRWISRSRSAPDGEGGFSGPMIAAQRIATIGRGVSFQSASRDGSVVYFKTNAPLTPDDPNGGVDPVEGAASNDSWDLYRYQLPDEGDPGDGTLTRISGGPDGDADPSTNAATGSEAIPLGYGGAARFVSDEGTRAYFVTTAPIAGADQSPPFGGVTDPGGAAGNAATRNLYLFEDEVSGAGRYRFIARLPTEAGSGSALDNCATIAPATGFPIDKQGIGGAIEFLALPDSCFRGAPSGDVAAFTTTARLTGDDVDDVPDIYLYDARSDELVRVSDPPPGTLPGDDDVLGNGDFGQGPTSGIDVNELDTTRGWGGGRTYNFAVNPNGDVSLFFESRVSLVPEDANETGWDTYEWREGRLSLISSGAPGEHAYYSGNSTDGEDVFVFTGERIDPREIDDRDYDIYDYRRDGGIPYTPPPTPCDVLALACEVEAVNPPPVPVTASATRRGSGNLRTSRPRRCRKGMVRRRGRCVRKCVLARKACRAKTGKAKRRCVRGVVRRVR